MQPAFLAAPTHALRAPRTHLIHPRRPPQATQPGPDTPAPCYKATDRKLPNAVFTQIFLGKLEIELGRSASRGGYDGVVEAVRALATRHLDDARGLQAASGRVLDALLPLWLGRAFGAVFSRNLPGVAAAINARVTVATTQWLMGRSRVGEDGVSVEIERCRYLEGMYSFSSHRMLDVDGV